LGCWGVPKVGHACADGSYCRVCCLLYAVFCHQNMNPEPILDFPHGHSVNERKDSGCWWHGWIHDDGFMNTEYVRDCNK
jgi:hypothetical protein